MADDLERIKKGLPLEKRVKEPVAPKAPSQKPPLPSTKPFVPLTQKKPLMGPKLKMPPPPPQLPTQPPTPPSQEIKIPTLKPLGEETFKPKTLKSEIDHQIKPAPPPSKEKRVRPSVPTPSPPQKPASIDLKTAPYRYGLEALTQVETAEPKKVPAKKSKNLKKILLIVIILTLAGFGAWLITSNFVIAPPKPSAEPPTQRKAPPIQQEAPKIPDFKTSFIPIEGVEVLKLKSGKEDNLLNIIRAPLVKSFPEKSFTKIALIVDEKELAFSKFLAILGAQLPFGLTDKFDDEFNLFIFTQEPEKNLFSLVVKLKSRNFLNPTSQAILNNQLNLWQKTMAQDLKILLSQDQNLTNQPRQRFNYLGYPVYFQTFPQTEEGIFWTIAKEKQLWLWTTSRQAMISLIDRLGD